jgi:hypothetical protein
MPRKSSAEIVVPMMVDVDGAANAYGPNDSTALDYELNAHEGARKSGSIVGYLTKADGRTPIVQGPTDPYPGFYISTSGYTDKNNSHREDPRRYVNAAEINYTLWARVARDAGVALGDFCTVHSLRTGLTVYAIVGDSGNNSGAEGSAALLRRLSYNVNGGKSGGEDDRKIVVRYFAGTNPNKLFFFHQPELEARARALDLDIDFSSYHRGDPGRLVLAAIASTGADLRFTRNAPFVPLPKNKPVPDYPGHLIKLDSDDEESVEIIQQRLRGLGFTESWKNRTRPLSVDGEFGNDTLNAVKLFQARHTDLHGRPLEIDGEVGSDTWGALFGRKSIHTSPPQISRGLMAKVLEVAAGEIGVLENPPGSNRGERVEQYQRSVGIDRGEPWCVAFIYFCFATAAKALSRGNPMQTAGCRTGSVLELWNQARQASKVRVVLSERALDDPALVKPGMIFVISTGGGHGHVGLVSNVIGNRLETIEGNTNAGGSREGIGVCRHSSRTIAGINRGFIDFSGA